MESIVTPVFFFKKPTLITLKCFHFTSLIKAEISIIIFLRKIAILLVFQKINSEELRRCLKINLLLLDNSV